mmetsp:Transcript_18074/g.30945  ORF Transcript_18074/g.30945 Transcript_18074/m.30945 type:complete len:265 (+) Transcript_18074:684-1478(+)
MTAKATHRPTSRDEPCVCRRSMVHDLTPAWLACRADSHTAWPWHTPKCVNLHQGHFIHSIRFCSKSIKEGTHKGTPLHHACTPLNHACTPLHRACTPLHHACLHTPCKQALHVVHSRALRRSSSISMSIASLTGRPAGSAATGSAGPLSVMPFLRSASSSSTDPLSSCANLSSILSLPTSNEVLSASASIAITFSSILSNATTELLVLSDPIISWICLLVFALVARALRVSFFPLASVNFPSSKRELLITMSTALACISICTLS